MKKIYFVLSVLLTSVSAVAGGLSTNTNQNAAFLRFFAQDANITLTSIYANPAGGAFLRNGWHFGLSNQIASQRRNITSFSAINGVPMFSFNPNNNGNAEHTYKGKAFAPLVPSLTASYNRDKWSISAHVGLIGGGGACEYLDGIGSFETMYAAQIYGQVAPTYIASAVPVIMAGGADLATATAMAQVKFAQNYRYGTDAYMKGNSYNIGFQIGATYKILENLAVYGGLRGIYSTANYNGYVQDIKYSVDGGQHYTYVCDPATGQSKSLTMNCDQEGFGITPILGIDWQINKHWNVAAKYEFKTRLRLKNTTRMNEYTKELAATNPTIGNFADGNSVPDDMPGILVIGAQYSPIEDVRIGVGYHWYDDCAANKGTTAVTDAQGNTAIVRKQDLIDKGTHEVVAGIEWKCCKWLTVSGSWQKTIYGTSDAYMNDISFNTSSNSMGLGVRIHPSKLFNIDLGFMHTFYEDRTVASTTPASATAMLTRIDTYSRNNNVFGIGFNFAW